MDKQVKLSLFDEACIWVYWQMLRGLMWIAGRIHSEKV